MINQNIISQLVHFLVCFVLFVCFLTNSEVEKIMLFFNKIWEGLKKKKRKKNETNQAMHSPLSCTSYFIWQLLGTSTRIFIQQSYNSLFLGKTTFGNICILAFEW